MSASGCQSARTNVACGSSAPSARQGWARLPARPKRGVPALRLRGLGRSHLAVRCSGLLGERSTPSHTADPGMAVRPCRKMLSRTVAMTASRWCSPWQDCLPGRLDQTEDERTRVPRTEPAHEDHGRHAQPGPFQRDRHRSMRISVRLSAPYTTTARLISPSAWRRTCEEENTKKLRQLPPPSVNSTLCLRPPESGLAARRDETRQ